MKMSRLIALCLLILSLTAQAEDRYQVKFSPDLNSVTVQACFEGAPPRSLHRHDDAWQYTEFVQTPERMPMPVSRSGQLKLSGMPHGSCLKWGIDLAAAVAEDDYRLALTLGGAVLTDADLWFWRDNQRRKIRVEVELPEGMSLSTPWKNRTSDGSSIFWPESTPAAWSSRIAIGRFPVQKLSVSGTQIRLSVIGEVTDIQRDLFANWIQETAECVASIEGRFPQSQPQILVVATGPQNEPIPWAHIIRGGGVAAEFFVDETRSLEEFRSDWTATHELSHMLLPMVSSRDRWLSEGLASYYQNVLRGRDGRLDEVAAWQKLHAGFERGKRATRQESLAWATRNGRDTIMRVYWSGAAMFLKADIQLRAVSGGSQSLDTALASLQGCCMDAGRIWRARELFTKLDQLTGHTIFMDLYNQHVPAKEFPELEETYAQLGLVPRASGMELDPAAPLSRVRLEIMQATHQ